MKNESRDSRDVDTYEITAISGKRLKWVKKHGLEDERSDETVNLPQFEEEILRWISYSNTVQIVRVGYLWRNIKFSEMNITR